MLRGPEYLSSPEKRATDIAMALGCLGLLGIPTLGGMAAIKILEGQSPIFRQSRLGKAGVAFDINKLQTMHPTENPVGALHTKNDRTDTRITRTGRILRATNLDEVPQVLNVLRGEMSFVAPRALPKYEHEFCQSADPQLYSEYVAATALFRPGIVSHATYALHELQRKGLPDDGRRQFMRETLDFVEKDSIRHDIEAAWMMPREAVVHALSAILPYVQQNEGEAA